MTPQAGDPALRAGIAARIAQVLTGFAAEGTILFLGAGSLAWSWAWVFLAIGLVTMLVNGALLLRKRPETVAERARGWQTRGWDKVVGGLCAVAMFAGVPLVAGLDQRFGWTGTFPTEWHVAGAFLLVGGYALSLWAMLANAFFSTAIRIQSERGHTVCRSGPYRFVRHPGYVAFSLQSLATPVLLGSVWALLPGVAAGALLVLRTALEDRMLRAELPGYEDFTAEVRYRLVPGIW
jgi:protein-S-isoprenylcysteine O-methyltransferase Ste14